MLIRAEWGGVAFVLLRLPVIPKQLIITASLNEQFIVVISNKASSRMEQTLWCFLTDLGNNLPRCEFVSCISTGHLICNYVTISSHFRIYSEYRIVLGRMWLLLWLSNWLLTLLVITSYVCNLVINTPCNNTLCLQLG